MIYAVFRQSHLLSPKIPMIVMEQFNVILEGIYEDLQVLENGLQGSDSSKVQKLLPTPNGALYGHWVQVLRHALQHSLQYPFRFLKNLLCLWHVLPTDENESTGDHVRRK